MHNDGLRVDQFPIALATEIAQQTSYSKEQALRGIYGMLSCYGNTEDTYTAIKEFIKCNSMELHSASR